ncbi:MAG: peptidylprolyl isomerase [Bacteroidia bacterium]|nr:peptidylprolyl isomerase [Bacteroidia bacterium]
MYSFKIKTTLAAIMFAAMGSVFGQLAPNVIFSYKNNPVSLEEFEYQYLKNKKVGDETITEADIREYLDLYVKFKLKYQDAKDAGMDTLRDYTTELAGYRNQLARNYLYDKEVTDALVLEAYNRMLQEVRAAHILVTVDADASPADTLAAYNKIKASYDMVMSGKATFEDQARSMSDDPGSKENGGDLGYFTALQLVYPFENEAYNTAKGDISKIFRTQFGYHYLKVLDKRANKGDIKVRHIQLRVGHNANATEEAVKKNIDDIYQKLSTGESTFEKMAYSYSEDYNSKYQGGEMDFISVTQFVGDPERQRWADMAFNLANDGDISMPFRTALGWHILQRVRIRPLGTFDVMKNTLKTQVRNDQRSQKSVNALVEKVKIENNYAFFESSFNALLNSLDSNYKKGTFKKEQLPQFAPLTKPAKPVRGNVFVQPNVSGTPLVNLEIFRLGTETHNVGEFATYLEKNSKPVNGSVEINLKEQYQNWTTEQCVAYQDKHLEEKSAEFKNIYQEYAEGILMFYRKKDMVWDKANSDSVGLDKYFSQHREEYRWKDRFLSEVYFCESEAGMNKVAKQVKKKMIPDSIKAYHNRIKPLSVDYKKGKYEETDNYLFADKKMLADLFANPAYRKKNKIVKLGKYGDDYVLVKVNEFIPAGLKTLSETRGPVTAKYEEYLEEIWTAELQQRYPVVINDAALTALISRLTK